MASIPTWQKHWQIPFKSFSGTAYTIYIYDWDYQGNIVTLTGAPEPIMTREDSTQDTFTPIRKQTGYIRVIATPNEATLLADLMPANNTERLVRLTHIEDNATVIDWQGFMMAQAFEQPWNGAARMLEFPIQSILGSLESVQIQTSAVGTNNKRLSGLLVQAITDLMRGSTEAADTISEVVTIDDLLLTVQWQQSYVPWSAFFHMETTVDQGDSRTEFYGMSWADILAGVCDIFGYTLRENGSQLILAKYDDLAVARTSTWAQIVAAAEGSLPTGTALTIDTGNILDLDYIGNINQQGFLLGAKSSKVVLGISNGLSLNITLPAAPEDDTAIIRLEYPQLANQGDVFLGQPHPGVSRGYEDFHYYEYNDQLGNSVSPSNYAACLANCILKRPNYNPHIQSSTDHLITGSFPVRWLKYNSSYGSNALMNGILLNTQYLQADMGTFRPNYCYSINSGIPHTLKGWLRLDMQIYYFLRDFTSTPANEPLHFQDAYTSDVIACSYFFALQYGDKWWNGSAWVTASTAPTFNIPFKNGEIVTNKPEDTNLEENGGWWIPISEQMSGVVTLHVLNYCAIGYPDNLLTYAFDTHTHILCDLNLHFVGEVTLTESSRSSNTYFRQNNNGFSDKAEKSLLIGTKNNNPDSVVFLRNAVYTDYIQMLLYRTNIAGTESKLQRMEVHLVKRMMAYYNQSHQTLSADIRQGEDIFTKRWSYAGKTFFGVDYNHNWAKDQQNVQFFEILENQ